MPALRGDGIRHALLRRASPRDRAAAEQPRPVVDDRRLPRRDAIFDLRKADPLAVQRGGHGSGERAHLDADFALLLADPVPWLDPHRLDGEGRARADDDALPLRLDAHDVQRRLLSADLDPAALPDGEVADATAPAGKGSD